MHVCLISPPCPYLRQPKAQAPLGLLYVASALREVGVGVELLDLREKPLEGDFEFPEADLYGLTGTVIDRIPIEVVAQNLKQQKPDAKVVVGGPISLTPDLLDQRYIDSVVIGEGERTILSILDCLPHLQKTYRSERIRDLDSLAFPARDLIDDLGGNVFAFNQNYREGGSSVIITGRGCPYNCAFCASPGIWKRRVYFRSPENVLAEVDEIMRYGVTQLRFSDDTFTLKRKRLTALCEGLGQKNVVWRASIRTVPNDLEMFQMMYEGGCREVSFGVESGDQDVLDKVQKGTSVEDNRTAIINAKRAGLVVRILFMIGTPGETTKTVDKNIAFLSDLDYDTIALTTFIPIPGSAISNHPERYGCKILDRNIDHYNFYLWGPDGENEWRDLIALDNLTPQQLADNRERMKQFVIESGRSNRG